MAGGTKVSRNDPCPCGSGKKYKHCCRGRVDWTDLFRSGEDWRNHLSIRGRNLHFANRIAEALQLDGRHGAVSLERYKAAFTVTAVRRVHEAILEVWPPDLDIVAALRSARSGVSGLYIGDYGLEYVTRGILRHSIYANKILVVDPFTYPLSVRDEFNPILNPEQYRVQTLKNVNFWYSLMPWIDAGVVEIIRTPADFDPKLNRKTMESEQAVFDSHAELRKANEDTAEELMKRHLHAQGFRLMFLAAPEAHLRKMFDELRLAQEGFTIDDFLNYIRRESERDPEVLGPLGPGKASAQLHMMSTGSNYEIAKLTANLTGSYLVTDLQAKWRRIEIDRQSHSVENKTWSPFAKAMQEAPLRYFDHLRLEHALALRKEGRLESLRVFLRKVWKNACSEDSFADTDAQLLADELVTEVRKAEDEWKQIDRDLLKIVGAEASAGILAAGPLIAAGQAEFLAAAAALVGLTTLASSHAQRGGFPDKCPAAFFMKL